MFKTIFVETDTDQFELPVDFADAAADGVQDEADRAQGRDGVDNAKLNTGTIMCISLK